MFDYSAGGSSSSLVMTSDNHFTSAFSASDRSSIFLSMSLKGTPISLCMAGGVWLAWPMVVVNDYGRQFIEFSLVWPMVVVNDYGRPAVLTCLAHGSGERLRTTGGVDLFGPW